jgi:hypothetical protein
MYVFVIPCRINLYMTPVCAQRWSLSHSYQHLRWHHTVALSLSLSLSLSLRVCLVNLLIPKYIFLSCISRPAATNLERGSLQLLWFWWRKISEWNCDSLSNRWANHYMQPVHDSSLEVLFFLHFTQTITSFSHVIDQILDSLIRLNHRTPVGFA